MTAEPTSDLERFAPGVRFLSAPSSGPIEPLVAQVIARAARGEEIVLQTPARTEQPFAQRLFEAHDALCFEAGLQLDGKEPALLTYFGPRAWAFARAFAPHGTVFLRGRGHVGPWSGRTAT